MNAYRLTEKKTIALALEKARPGSGKSGGKSVRIEEIRDEDNVSESIVIRVSEPIADDLLTYTFKTNYIKIRVQLLDGTTYRVKDIVIEPITRTAKRVESRTRVYNVSFAPTVDIASSIALYGKTSNIAKACQMMKMLLVNHLNAYRYMVSECDIGFFFASDSELLQKVEEAGDNFFMVDALNRSIHGGPGYANPVEEFAKEKQDAFYTRYARGKIRSQYIFPFRDQVGTVMGYFDLRSTTPALGRAGNLTGPDAAGELSLFNQFLFQKAEELVFQMEMYSIKNWIPLAESEELVDLSQDGRGARITIRNPEAEKHLRKGAKIQFAMPLQNSNHGFITSVRLIKKTEEGLHVGVRINRGSEEQSLQLLGNYAQGLIPGSL